MDSKGLNQVAAISRLSNVPPTCDVGNLFCGLEGGPQKLPLAYRSGNRSLSWTVQRIPLKHTDSITSAPLPGRFWVAENNMQLCRLGTYPISDMDLGGYILHRWSFVPQDHSFLTLFFGRWTE